jgi:hypothetical protein
MEMKDKLPAINSLLQNPPAEFGFSAQDLEEIVRGEGLRGHLETIDDGFYLDNFPAALGWCLRLGRILTAPIGNARVFLYHASISHSYDKSDEIQARVEVIMQLFVVAHEAVNLIGALSSDPTGLEMVKRYCELRTYILDLIKRDFPGVDFGPMLKAA